MGKFWGKKKDRAERAKRAASNLALETIQAEAPSNTLRWIKDGIEEAFKEIELRRLMVLAIEKLESQDSYKGLGQLVKVEMRSILKDEVEKRKAAKVVSAAATAEVPGES